MASTASPYDAYKWIPACGNQITATQTGQGPCANDAYCVAPERLYKLMGLRDGAWLLIRQACFAAGGPDTPQVTPALVARAFQRIPIPTYASLAQPTGRTLVNFDTIFHAEAAAFTRTLTLLGQRVELRITPTRFVWHFGDGTTQTTSTPGAAYPSKAITHRYQHAHLTVRHRLTVTWTATYRLNGGPEEPVPGSVVRTGPATALRIAEAVPALTAG